jgi:hypothetical protein
VSRFGRVRRRPDYWKSPHERARLRMAERMAGALGLKEASWLDEHLADCPACSSVAAQYAADRLALRALRDAAPEPPRDLWARTAAAIEQESAGRRPATTPSPRRGSRIPLGALSGIAVIAVVIGVSTLSANLFVPQQPAAPEETAQRSTTGGDVGSGGGGAQATPFAVGAGVVEWVDKTGEGLAYVNAAIDEVCPADGTSNCPALRQADQQRMSLDSEPKTIIGSPSDGQAVMITDDGSGGNEVVLVDLPERTPAPASQSATPDPTPTTPTVPSTAPTAPTVTASAGASATPASGTPPPSVVPSESPSESPGTDTSVGSPAPASAPPSPSLSPSPSVAIRLAIASDIELVGESAAFSADGSWFAFTARPSDGSRGPDVYVWRVGDGSARSLTVDGSTVFGSWDGDQIVASRPDPTTTEGPVTPVTVRIDPVTAAETPAGDVWQPIVDPTRKRAIGWTGSLTKSTDGMTWTPDAGKLELHRWTATGAEPSDDGSGATANEQVVTDSAPAGFDVRWDESGEWVAVWVADAADPEVGRLTLHRVGASSELELPADAPTGVPALPGFSIGEGRLAWATPPGQNGEGSRIQIVAWSDDGVGTVESAPGEDLVVVR